MKRPASKKELAAVRDYARKPHLAWAVWAFGSVASSKEERALRFLEEAMELAQACGISAEQATKVGKRTWARPVGQVATEVAQASLTLTCLSEALDVDQRTVHCQEFMRVRTFTQEYWERRHAVKAQYGIVAGADDE